MKGLLLVSHGKMAEGIVDSLTVFYGQKPEQLDALALTPQEGPDQFLASLKLKVNELDMGEGVLIFADLFGGTPSNMASLLLNDHVQLISGMNLPLVLEYLGQRNNEQSLSELVETAKSSIVYVNDILKKKKEKESNGS